MRAVRRSLCGASSELFELNIRGRLRSCWRRFLYLVFIYYLLVRNCNSLFCGRRLMSYCSIWRSLVCQWTQHLRPPRSILGLRVLPHPLSQDQLSPSDSQFFQDVKYLNTMSIMATRTPRRSQSEKTTMKALTKSTTQFTVLREAPNLSFQLSTRRSTGPYKRENMAGILIQRRQMTWNIAFADPSGRPRWQQLAQSPLLRQCNGMERPY